MECKQLSDATVASITNKECSFEVTFFVIPKTLKLNINII